MSRYTADAQKDSHRQQTDRRSSTFTPGEGYILLAVTGAYLHLAGVIAEVAGLGIVGYAILILAINTAKNLEPLAKEVRRALA